MNGQLLKQGNEQDAYGNETGTIQFGDQPNLSQQNYQGEI
jgi:hypothetical protein